jgi:CPA1 family monovalent cation:H+ antiporter
METAALVKLLLILLIAASAIALVTLKLRVPYTIALVCGGFLIDIFHLPITEWMGEGGPEAFLTPEVIFMVFLPGLLFEAGLNIQSHHLRANALPILMIAVLGVLIATLVTGFAVYWLLGGLPLMVALVFGALISATDPISVLALFRELGVSKRLSVLVEGESLFNDGTAVVLFQILVAAVATQQVSVIDGVAKFLVVALGGAAVGLTLGYVMSKVTEQVDNPQIEITLTVILAYGSFLVAEEFHLSGVIATVGAGVMVGNFAADVGMSSRTRVALWSFWEYLGFVINSLIFLLIGIEVHIADLAVHWWPITIAIAVVLLGRVVAIYTITPLGNLFTRKIPTSWMHVMMWGGIHGGVSIALALSLRPDFPHRPLIMAMTFGVVAFSIVVQGLTVPTLMRKLGIEMGAEGAHDRAKVDQMAVSASLAELDILRKRHVVSPTVYDKLAAELRDDLNSVEDTLKKLHAEDPDWTDAEEKLARAHLLGARKAAIQRAVNDGAISLHTAEQMLSDADDRIDELGGVGGH